MIAETISAEPRLGLQKNWNYLQDELARVRLLLLRHALWQQTRSAQPELAAETFFGSDPQARALSAELETVAARCRATIEQNALPLKQLVFDFGLTSFEAEVLLLALAVELDTSFETLFTQCQPDAARRLPTVALALRLCCDTVDGWIEARTSFSTGSPLVHFGMIHLDAHADSLLASTFHLDERIVNYLLGINRLPAALAARLRRVATPGQLIHGEQIARLGAIIRRALESTSAPRRLLINLFGPQGAGKRTFAAAACGELNIPVLAANAGELVAENALLLFLRETILQHAAAYLDCVGLAEEARPSLIHACDDGARLIFVGTLTRATWFEPAPETLWIPFEVAAPSAQERRQLWQIQLGEVLNGQGDALAVRFPFTPGDISHIVDAAQTAALARTPDEPQLTPADVWRAARAHPQHRLSELARRIEPHYTWEDIVLPAEARQQLREVQQQVAYQTRVYEDWGWGRKMMRGRGVSALFSGSSGTGKTMAAEILAGALELELYRIDLSCVVSKYIGETEKNLARVFDEAERSGVILFFDEADALFGKRSEVKDSHDRYANIEINYLLQRMEDYQGLVILATNMRQALDEAFLRRLRFLIEFPFPDANLRTQIWRKAFTPETPQAELDFEFLAHQFKIPGGNIRNIVLNAAFMAAAENAPVQMPHLIRATKREFDKIGKACLESDFGRYFALVK